MMPVHVEVEYFLFYQALLFIADYWPLLIISVRILCGYNVCFTVIYDTRKYIDVHS